MGVYDDGVGTRKAALGLRVERAAGALPATTASAIFNVSGKVEITSIVGEVTTVIQNQANNTKLTANPTTGTSADLCAVLDIANDEAGALYSISGTASDALQGGTAGATPGMGVSVIVNTGTIDLSCAATNTGAIKWAVTYVPLDDEAAVTAA